MKIFEPPQTPSPYFESEPEGPPHPWDWPTALVLIGVHLGLYWAPSTFSWSGLAIALLLYTLSAMGITIGFHRLLTHRSYRCHKWLEYLFTWFGIQACQGGPMAWVATHRLHHKHSDQPEDPHGADQGFWWSHMGWLFYKPPRTMKLEVKKRLTPDLYRDPIQRFFEKTYLLHVIGLGSLLYSIGGSSWFVWGMVVRLVAVYHATWLVNSAAHKFGYRSYATKDLSTNCWWVALLTFGEGWHNNHHAFPASARHGLETREVDLTWQSLRLLERVGLVWNLKLPKASQIQAFTQPKD